MHPEQWAEPLDVAKRLAQLHDVLQYIESIVKELQSDFDLVLMQSLVLKTYDMWYDCVGHGEALSLTWN